MYNIVKDINKSVFRGYDLRGIVGQDLNDDVMYTLGRAYATYLSKRRIEEAPVGRDNRLSSEQFSKAFIRGLNDGGINTYDLGLSLTQIVYFSSYEFKTRAGAMISASHNPKEYNGLKLSVGYSDTMITEEIQNLRSIVQAGEYSQGKGVNQQVDVFPAYLKDIVKNFRFNKRWKIVVDGCNTASGFFYPPLFRMAGCEVIEKNTILDGNFPLGVPDPTEEKVLSRLSKAVLESHADIGFAYDSDGDRMSVVDETGAILWMDVIIAVFVKDVLEYLPGSPIVFNTLCSKIVPDTIRLAGGIPVMYKTGHSFIKAKVREMRAPFGGELSGHIFFMDDFYGHDDGAYASLRLLQYLDRNNTSLSSVIAQLPKYYSSPEIKLGLAEELKFDFVSTRIAKDFKQKWPNGDFIDIDGIRVDTADEMAIIRASQNGPYITVKFEGRTSEQYEELKKWLKTTLEKYPEVDWSKGVNTQTLVNVVI